MPKAMRQGGFPPPWSAEETEACFIVRDHNGQALASRRSRAGARRRICSRETRQGGSRRTSPSCRNCWCKQGEPQTSMQPCRVPPLAA